MSILKEMEEVIKKSLPQQTAEQLKIYFAEHDKLKKEHSKLSDNYNSVLERVEEYKTKESQYNSLQNRKKVVENEEHALQQERQKFEEEKRNLKVDRLEYQLAESKKRSDDAIRFVDTLVRNPRSTEYWSSNKSLPIQGKYSDGSTYDTFHNINETITKDTEEHK